MALGLGVIKPISTFPLFVRFSTIVKTLLPIGYHLHIWQVPVSYESDLKNVTDIFAKLSPKQRTWVTPTPPQPYFTVIKLHTGACYGRYILTRCQGTLLLRLSHNSLVLNIIINAKLRLWRCYVLTEYTSQWRHNERDGVSNHQPHDCLRNRLFRRRSKKTSKLRVAGLCAGNSPMTGEFPAQMASNTGNVSIWWRHHGSKGVDKGVHLTSDFRV